MKAPSENDLIWCAACGDRIDATNRAVVTVMMPADGLSSRKWALSRYGFCTSDAARGKVGCISTIDSTISHKAIEMKTRGSLLSGEMGGLKQNW